MSVRLQWLATVVFVVAGVLLLMAPAAAPAQVKAGAPTRFTVVDAGTAGKPDVVLIPGLTSGREVWEGEAKKLAPNYRLHLVQVNGFAGQAAGPNATGEILPAIVDELHGYCGTLATKPVVMGHSLGGLMTLMLAEKYPADVKKIVIVDSLPWYGMLFGPQATVEMVKPQVAMMRDGIEKQDAATRKAGAERTAEQLAADPEARKLVAKESEDSDAHVFAEAMYEDMLTDLRTQVATIKTPALMLYPLDTTLAGPMGTKQTAEIMDGTYQGAFKAMPNVKLVRVDNSRHFIMLDQPEKFDAAVEAFLKS